MLIDFENIFRSLFAIIGKRKCQQGRIYLNVYEMSSYIWDLFILEKYFKGHKVTKIWENLKPLILMNRRRIFLNLLGDKWVIKSQ